MSVLGDALRAMTKQEPSISRYNPAKYKQGYVDGYRAALEVASVIADAWPPVERGDADA